MFLLKSRREREQIIVLEMIRMYCAGNHSNGNVLCEECSEIAVYSEKRLLSCMYGDSKPVCKECPVHCYSPQQREQMRKVMRFSGPRMLYHKPGFAIVHIIDNLLAPNPKPVAKRNKKYAKDLIN